MSTNINITEGPATVISKGSNASLSSTTANTFRLFKDYLKVFIYLAMFCIPKFNEKIGKI